MRAALQEQIALAGRERSGAYWSREATRVEAVLAAEALQPLGHLPPLPPVAVHRLQLAKLGSGAEAGSTEPCLATGGS
jgi:hypothetical protein